MKKNIVFFLLFITVNLNAQFRLSEVHNNTYIMKAGSRIWQEAVGQGYDIAFGSQVKTGFQSTAELLINKHIILSLREDTIIKIYKTTNEFIVELIKGSVNIASQKDISNLCVKSLLAELKILSKSSLIKNINNNLLISVFDNKVLAKVKDNDISIGQGYGLEITPKLDDLIPFPLPNSPLAEFPADRSIISAGINLKWTTISEAILYRIEISLDKDFINVILKDEISANIYSTTNLSDGEYYWRVSAINRKNLEGAFFDYDSFSIQKQAGTSLLISEKEDDDVKISPPDYDKNIASPENTMNSIIMGSIILLSVVILILL